MADAQVSSATVESAGARSQRRFARAQVNIDASYEYGTPVQTVPGKVLNLGGGGLRVASAEDLKREEMLTLRFRIPNVDHDLKVRGKVVLSFFDAAQQSYSHGVAFTQIARADQDAIVAYVESLENHVASDRS